ncbi:MAG TPA: hypothetical protein VF070_18620 [Streptosporangiaceae bacterium]
MDEVEATCVKSKAIFEKCEGSFIDQISLNVEYEHDRLYIVLRQVPELGEVSISLARVRNFELEKGPELGGSFVDSVEAIYLPPLDQPWPLDAEKRVRRFSGLPSLIWLKIVGPTPIDVICESMSVTCEPSY